mmetsp:Transcript_7862/g.16391  ORF Transcript_7862/g.16391 Transcript_7862/m.16391 type:complete len:369 (+) Transcript_7862:512-1618(+)
MICTDVLRKGKQLCMVLQPASSPSRSNKKTDTTKVEYLYLHMGMTGSIQSPGRTIFWGHNNESPMAKRENKKKGGDSKEEETKEESKEEAEVFPPKYAYLTLQMGDYRAAFSDPRKFGKCELATNLDQMNELAPDALDDTVAAAQIIDSGKDSESDQDNTIATIIHNIANQSLGIKGLLLDQKRALSGVGNWVADEILYQIGMHPDQRFLTEVQAQELVVKLHDILKVAVECLEQRKAYPNDWLFLYRWSKAKAKTPQDCKGRNLTFLKSGGRTSAIVASLQKLKSTKRHAASIKAKAETSKKSQESKKDSKRKPAPETKAATKRQKKSENENDSATAAKATPRQPKQEQSATPSTVQRRRSPRLVSP